MDYHKYFIIDEITVTFDGVAWSETQHKMIGKYAYEFMSLEFLAAEILGICAKLGLQSNRCTYLQFDDTQYFGTPKHAGYCMVRTRLYFDTVSGFYETYGVNVE